MALTAEYVQPDAADRIDDRAATAQRWRLVLLAIVGVELALLYTPTVAWLFDRWTMSVWHHAHGLFMPPLIGWFVWRELKSRPELPVESSALGFAALVPALGLHALDAGMHTQLLSAVSLIVLLPALALLFLGVPRTKVILIPLLFGVFALPIPLGVTESLHLLLRQFTVAITTPLFPLLGVTVYAEGTTLHTVRGALQVADACSGFSTLYASIAVACLTAYTASSTRRRVLVLLAAAPLAIAANALRVMFLVGLVVWRGESILETSIHPLSGMATFALALPVIFWLGGPVAPRKLRS